MWCLGPVCIFCFYPVQFPIGTLHGCILSREGDHPLTKGAVKICPKSFTMMSCALHVRNIPFLWSLSPQLIARGFSLNTDMMNHSKGRKMRHHQFLVLDSC